MRTRILGRTGLQVTELSLGGLFVASWFNEQEQACTTVRRAIELGVNYIDTAPGYGNSEEVLGKALKASPRRSSLHQTRRASLPLRSTR